MSNKWTKAEVIISGVSLMVAIAGFANKEIRQCLGLEPGGCPFLKPPSEVGADYSQLEKYLASGNFKAADIETKKRMFWVSTREKEGWLDSKSVEKFPCTDLHTIDKLWGKYSEDKFGFSVQKRIYQEEGKDLGKFGERVRWRMNNKWLEYDKLIFDKRAPEGHLPRGVVMWLDSSPLLSSPLFDNCKI